MVKEVEPNSRIGFYLAIILVSAALLFISDGGLTGDAIIGKDYIGDVSGAWDIVGTSDERDCGEGIKEEKEVITISQLNDKITISSKRYTLKGQIKGNKFDLAGSYPEDKGITHVSYVGGVLSADCNSLSLTGNWTWVSNSKSKSCKGPTEVKGTRQNPIGCQVPIICKEDWSCGQWNACSNGKQTRTCTDSNSCNTFEQKPVEEQRCEEEVVPAPRERAAPRLDYTFVILLFVLILIVAAVIYLLVKISGKRGKLIKQMRETIGNIHESVERGDKASALEAYNNLTNQFVKFKPHLKEEDIKRIYDESVSAYEEIMKL